nr:unnamed protein product [Callosobruchus analis]
MNFQLLLADTSIACYIYVRCSAVLKMQTSVKIVVAGVVSLVFIVVVGFILLEPIMRFGVKDQTCLKKGNEVRDIYLKLPFPLDFKIYFFNVSNPDQVQNGALPVLKEVGPYCYDEYKTKVDVVDNDAEDSLTYSPYDIFSFSQNKSGGLDDNEYVTILNPIIVGMVNQVAKDSPALLSIVNQAIVAIFQPKSMYITARVRDILFDGIEIDCNATDFAAKAVCAQIKTLSAFKAHETKKNVFLFSVFGTFNLVSSYCRSVHNCGGVAIWAKNHILASGIDLSIYCIEKDFEICGVRLKLYNKSYIVLACYRSPSGDKSIFLSKINIVMDFLYQPNINFILCGDINLDSLICNRYFDLLCMELSSFNIFPVVQEPTRVTANSSTSIDHIFTDISHKATVTDNVISDHRTVLLEFVSEKSDHNISSKFRSYSDVSINKFMEALRNEDWNSLYGINDFNDAFDCFYNIFIYYFQQFFPERMTRYQQKQKSWVNDAIRKSCTDLRDLYKMSKKFPQLSDLYKLNKYKHKLLVRDTKKRFYQNKIAFSNNKSRAAWNVISELNNHKKCNKNIAIKDNDIIIENPSEVANLFNDYFIQSPKNLTNSIKIPPKYTSPEYMGRESICECTIELHDLRSGARGPILNSTVVVRDKFKDYINHEGKSSKYFFNPVPTAFPLFQRNATVGGRIKVSRGISNYKDVGRVLEIDGKKEINLWTTEWCNRFRGTDGWIIPPLLEEGESVRVFGTDLCRNIEVIPVSKDYMKGLHVRVYEATMGDMEHNENDKCYCSSPTTCMKKGLFDLSKCMGVPIIVTLPHFLETDSYYLEKVYGLVPRHEDHVLKLVLEPMTSTPLIVKKRAQLNLMISAVPRITVMQNVSEALHPIFWMEEGLVLEGPLLTKVQTIFIAIKVLKVLNYIGLLASLGTIAYGSYGYFKNRKSVKVTPSHEATNRTDDEITRSTNVLISTINRMEKKAHNNPALSGHEFGRYNT